MTDIWSPEKRSQVMGRIRSTGNAKTELRLISIMRARGITGWRRHVELLGRPDFTFRPERVVVFVDGCFWHGCPQCYREPASNADYWSNKVLGNRRRDRLVSAALRRDGWKVLRIWEHQLAYPARVACRLRRVLGRAP